jgi:hypothetical protein
MKSLHSLILFMPFVLNHFRLPFPELDPVLDKNSNDLLCSSIIPRYGPPVVEKTSLLIRCLVMDVLFLLAYASAEMCLPSRCLAMSLYVTIPYRYKYRYVRKKARSFLLQ